MYVKTRWFSSDYAGEEPLCEAETQHLAAFLLDNSETIKGYLSLHSFGNLLMYPYAYKRNAFPPDIDRLV